MANQRNSPRDPQRQNRFYPSAPYYSEHQRNRERYGDNIFGRPYSEEYPYTERNYNQEYGYPYGTGSRAQADYRGGTYEGGYSNPDYRHADDYRRSGHDDGTQHRRDYWGSDRHHERAIHRHGSTEDFGREQRSPWERTGEGTAPWNDSPGENYRYSARNSGRFKGKGPKGYTRSDERIREDISDRLSDADDVDASEIEVTVSNGEVTLSGTVNDRYEKRRAEECAEQVSGVINVENRIRLSQR